MHHVEQLWSRMLRALDRLLVDDLLGLAPGVVETKRRTRLLLWVFAQVERLLAIGREMHTLHGGGVSRYEVARLPRGTRPLPLDPPVVAGDPVLILHYDTAALAALFAPDPSSRHVTWEAYARCKADLADLARRARAGELPPDVRVVWAEAAVYRAMTRFGFAVRPSRPTLRRPFARLYVVALLAIYGPSGRAPRTVHLRRHYDLGEGWLPIDRLLALYPPTD